MTAIFSQPPLAGPITGHFGPNEPGYPGGHGGVDFGVIVGTPIICRTLNPVLVQAVYTVPGIYDFGLWVCLDHDAVDGEHLYSGYAHMSRIDIRAGDVIQPGTQMGLSGNTGMSTGPHCHWALGTNPGFPKNFSQLRDPLAYIGAPEDDDMDAAEVKRLAAEVFGEVSASYYRQYTKLYWDRDDPDAYSEPPDPKVVAAIAKAVADILEGP
jgi:hypothetical protein